VPVLDPLCQRNFIYLSSVRDRERRLAAAPDQDDVGAGCDEGEATSATAQRGCWLLSTCSKARA
jgi:hypothetical protein